MPAHVLVVGSLHFDILVASDRLPRLGETFAGSAWSTKCGGKGGNQAIEAARHGGATAMVGCVGNDEFGEKLQQNLDDCGVDTGFINRAGIGSGISVAISDAAGDYGAVIVTGSNAAITEAQLALAIETLTGGSILVLQNEVPETVNIFAARGARAAGARIVVNAAPARPMAKEFLAMIDVLIVNAVEAEMLGGGAVEDLASAAAAAAFLTSAVPAVIVTAGGDGLALCAPEAALTIDPHAVRLVSTHGAGDAFVGALAAQLAAGAALEAAARYANAAAAVIVSTPEPDRRALTAAQTLHMLQPT